MAEALKLARMAADDGEVPVGCVVVRDGAVIGRGRNRREKNKSALAHAELEAIEEACAEVKDWRLSGCCIYVTLEPCPMCAGAILNARLDTVCYGARDPNTGSCGSVINLFEENYGFRPKIYGGIMEDECAGLLKDFFGDLRR